MASSKGSPGPHDRRPGIKRVTCVKLTRKGPKCQRYAVRGEKLCAFHRDQAIALEAGTIEPGQPVRIPDPSPSATVRGAVTTNTKRQAMTAFVVTEQAREALRKLNRDFDPSLDPKRVLLDDVNSAWRQRQVWEAMLAAVPEEDWADVGKPPIPGSQSSAKGARIETIQKFLLEATKTSARISKLAIDAGIEERLVRLAEEQSALIADTVRAGLIAGIGALAASGLITKAAEKQAIEAALASASTHLRVLAAGGEQAIEAANAATVSGRKPRHVEVRG